MVQINHINTVSTFGGINIKDAEYKKPSDIGVLDTADSVKLSANSFNESIMRKYNNTGFLKGYYTMEGSVNDKVVNLKYDNERVSLFHNKSHYNGVLGDDEVNIVIDSGNTSGKIGDKEVNLNYKTNFFGQFSITGTIGDKDINIVLNSPVDNANGENDILALVCSLQGLKLNTKNGQFTKCGVSAQQQTDNMEQALIMQQQMAANNAMYC